MSESVCLDIQFRVRAPCDVAKVANPLSPTVFVPFETRGNVPTSGKLKPSVFTTEGCKQRAKRAIFWIIILIIIIDLKISTTQDLSMLNTAHDTINLHFYIFLGLKQRAKSAGRAHAGAETRMKTKDLKTRRT